MAAQNANRNTDTLGNPPAQQDPTKPNRPGVNKAKHWVANTSWGAKMVKNTVAPLGANNVSGVNTIVIHETSRFPAYSSAQNMARTRFCAYPTKLSGFLRSQLCRPFRPTRTTSGRG